MKVLTAIQVEHRDSAIFKSVTETLYEVANVVTSIESAKSIRYNSTSPTPQHCITYVQVRQLQRENMGIRFIEKEIGKAKGFRPISLYGRPESEELIIELKLQDEGDAKKAIEQGRQP
jgi:hypothetical protein